MAEPQMMIDTDTRLATLETRMSGIEETLRQLVTDFRGRGHVPWGALLSAAAVFGGGLLWVVTTQTGPLAKDIAAQTVVADKLIGRLETLSDRVTTTFVSRDDLKDKFNAIDERTRLIGEKRDAWQTFALDRMEVNNRAVAALGEKIVSRGEHEQHWAAINERFDAGDRARERQGIDQQRQLDDLRTRFNDLYSARDIIRDDHEAIRVLQNEAAAAVRAR